MSKSLIKYLGDQPFFAILRGFLSSSEPRHIRNLASQHSLSPAGVSDIIHRLNSLGILRETKQKNRRCFYLELSDRERELFANFFSTYEKITLQERALRFSRDALKRFQWMSDAHAYNRTLKRTKLIR